MAANRVGSGLFADQNEKSVVAPHTKAAAPSRSLASPPETGGGEGGPPQQPIVKSPSAHPGSDRRELVRWARSMGTWFREQSTVQNESELRLIVDAIVDTAAGRPLEIDGEQ